MHHVFRHVTSSKVTNCIFFYLYFLLSCTGTSNSGNNLITTWKVCSDIDFIFCIINKLVKQYAYIMQNNCNYINMLYMYSICCTPGKHYYGMLTSWFSATLASWLHIYSKHYDISITLRKYPCNINQFKELKGHPHY